MKAGPLRTCLGCRARKERRLLRRLVMLDGPDGPRAAWDEAGTLGGRGAWLCADSPSCLEKGLKGPVLARAFRRALSGPPDRPEIKAPGSPA